MIRLMTSIDMILCVFVPDALMTVLVILMHMSHVPTGMKFYWMRILLS